MQQNDATPRWVIIRTFFIETQPENDVPSSVSVVDCNRYVGHAQINCLSIAVQNLENKVDEQNERFQAILSQLVDDGLLNFPWPSMLLFTANVLAIISIVKCLCGRKKEESQEEEAHSDSECHTDKNSQVVTDYSPSGKVNSMGFYQLSPETPVMYIPQQDQVPSTINSGIFYPGK